MSFAVSPVCEYVVDVMFTTSSVQVAPLSLEISILYPVTSEPPVFSGGSQKRSICVAETPFARRFKGAVGGFRRMSLTATESPRDQFRPWLPQV